METKRLGNTDITISAIALGGMPMSLSDRPSEEQAIATIHRALDLGVTLIDTADSYCIDESDKHHNERLIHKALQQYDGNVGHIKVATKGGLMRPNGSWTRNGNPEHLRETIQVSFEALGGEQPIDLWQYHAPDPNYTIEASLTPAKAAVEQGLIRCVGVSNFSVEQIKQLVKLWMWFRCRTSTTPGIASQRRMGFWSTVNKSVLPLSLGALWAVVGALGN